MVFGGIFRALGGLIGDAVLEEFEDRVDQTLDDAKVKVERVVDRVTENVMRRLIHFSFLIMGVVFGLVGLGIFLSRNAGFFSDGIGFVIIGLFILIVVALTMPPKRPSRDE